MQGKKKRERERGKEGRKEGCRRVRKKKFCNMTSAEEGIKVENR